MKRVRKDRRTGQDRPAAPRYPPLVPAWPQRTPFPKVPGPEHGALGWALGFKLNSSPVLSHRESSPSWDPCWSPLGPSATLVRAGAHLVSATGTRIGHAARGHQQRAGAPAWPHPLQLAPGEAKLSRPLGHGLEQLPIQQPGPQPGQVLTLPPPAPGLQAPVPTSPLVLLDLTFTLWPRLPGPPAALPGDPARVPAGWLAQPSITAPATSLSDRKQLAPSKRRSSDKHSLGNNKVAK